MDFEALYGELAHGIEIIRQLIVGVSQEEAQIKPAPDAWSILEVICHLYDEEREDFRPRLDIMLHRPDEAFPPNETVENVTRRRYNERDLVEVFEGFAAERAKSLDWLRSLNNPNWDAPYTTPYRSMKAGDMFASWVAHDSLHIRQLNELRWARIGRYAAPYDLGYAGEW